MKARQQVRRPPGHRAQGRAAAARLEASTTRWRSTTTRSSSTSTRSTSTPRASPRSKRPRAATSLKMARHSLGIIKERGKHHNPDTGSGGMLLGTIKAIGHKLAGRDLKVGDRIATLVSLSLTPLNVQEIVSINKDTCQVKVKARRSSSRPGSTPRCRATWMRLSPSPSSTLRALPRRPQSSASPARPCSSSAPAARAACSAPTRRKQARRPTGKVIGLVHGDAGKKRLERAGFCRRHHPGLGDRSALRLRQMVKS